MIEYTPRLDISLRWSSSYGTKGRQADDARTTQKRPKSGSKIRGPDQDPYNIKVYEILNKFSEIKAQIAAAEKNGEDTTKLTQDAWAIVFELGEYGVVTEERLLQNKEYWQNKAQEAIKRLRDGETQSASYRPANNDIVQVHTDDVSLKVQAEIEYKCYEWGPFSFYCYQTEVAWRGRSTAHAQAIMILPGTIYMEAG